MKNNAKDDDELDYLLKELDETIRSMPQEDVAYIIMRMFSEHRDIPEGSKIMFFNWLTDERGSEAKDKALWRLFRESFIECDKPSENAKEGLREIQVRLKLS